MKAENGGGKKVKKWLRRNEQYLLFLLHLD